MTRHTYNNGLPFRDQLKNAIDRQKTRISNKKPSLIIIDGLSGMGKTTLAVHILEYYTGKKIDYENQLAYGGEDFTMKVDKCIDKNYTSLIYDEAGDFNKRGAITAFNQRLNRFFDTYRTFKILPILCLPKFTILENHLFDKGIPRFLINIHRREENADYAKFKVYSLKSMWWIKFNSAKEVIPANAYNKSKPNFYGTFLNLPPERERELDEISTTLKRGNLKENVAKLKGLVTYKQIAEKLGYSTKYVSNTMSKHNIKPVSMYNRVAWFDASVVEILEDKLFNRNKGEET